MLVSLLFFSLNTPFYQLKISLMGFVMFIWKVVAVSAILSKKEYIGASPSQLVGKQCFNAATNSVCWSWTVFILLAN